MKLFSMLKRTVSIATFSAVVLSTAGAFAADVETKQSVIKNAKPIYLAKSEIGKVTGGEAVLLFDHTRRFDLNILAEFFSFCDDYSSVNCFAVDVSGTDEDAIKTFFINTAQKNNIYLSEEYIDAPETIFFKDNKELGVISKDSSLGVFGNVYLTYLAGNISHDEFVKMLDATEKAENYKKIVPRMNFVLMLAKKGENEAAIKELDKVDISELDDKGKLLLGQTYLRLKAPKKAYNIFNACESDVECKFYSGVASYLDGNNELARTIFNSIQDTYGDQEKLNFYLKKINDTEEGGVHDAQTN